MDNPISFPTEDQLKKSCTKTFRMQSTGADGDTTRISVPRDVVKREADKLGLTIKDFLKQYRWEWRYDSFPGAYGTFIPMDKENNDQP